MSIADQIAEVLTAHVRDTSWVCRCGWSAGTWRSEQELGAKFVQHVAGAVAEVTEAAVRARIAADIEAQMHDNAMRADHAARGISPEECFEQDVAFEIAARIARGGGNQ